MQISERKSEKKNIMPDFWSIFEEAAAVVVSFSAIVSGVDVS